MSVRLSYLSLILLIFSYDSQSRKIVILRIAPLCGNRVEDKTDWCIVLRIGCFIPSAADAMVAGVEALVGEHTLV